MHNIGTEVQYIATGDKIAQLVLMPVIHFRPVQLEDTSLYREDITMSTRGAGALGSTNSPSGLCAPSTGPPYDVDDQKNKHPLDGMPSGF